MSAWLRDLNDRLFRFLARHQFILRAWFAFVTSALGGVIAWLLGAPWWGQILGGVLATLVAHELAKVAYARYVHSLWKRIERLPPDV